MVNQLIKVLVVIGLLFFLSFTQCTEDKCDQEDIADVNVDFHSWGTVDIYNADGINIADEYAGTNFKVVFYKIYCNGNHSTEFEYMYHLLETTNLQKEGIGYMSFTMRNPADRIHLAVFVITPEGPTRFIADSETYNWFSGKVRALLKITFHTDQNNVVDWGGGTCIITYE